MPGLDPGIHATARIALVIAMDRRLKPGDDKLNWVV
jgi:hypothetical protein